MRILLAHNSTYYPSIGGGDKSNRLLMEALAARGHDVRVVTRLERFGEDPHREFLGMLAERNIEPDEIGADAVRFTKDGVEVHTLTRDPHLRAFFTRHLEESRPEVIVTSTDDPAQLLFDLAVRSPARVVFLIRATIAVPFGPEASTVSSERTLGLRRADGAVGVSEYVANYGRKYGGLDAIHVPISLLEPYDPPLLADIRNPYVTFVNPCAVKGLSIFLGMAERLPHIQFAAVPLWGTTSEDFAAMARLPNITLLPRYDNIDDLLRQTRVTLVPSVWAEARSRMVLESLARGIPVLGANVGGLREAMLGVDYLLPVNPVLRYKHAVDEHMVPVAEVPPQNVEPWVQTLEGLLSDPDKYAGLSRRSREAALNYMRNLTAEPFEKYLESLLAKPKRAPVDAAKTSVNPLDKLSPERRQLLALRLKRRGPSAINPWFPNLAELPPDAIRLFVFPYAGAGTLPFRSWRLPDAIQLCPVRLPGRENRQAERPFEAMTPLVDTLEQAIRPHLDKPFAFFGHSMGAGIAFELARALRREKLPLPTVLIVSAARAPQLRLGWAPPLEPDDEELLRRISRLEGGATPLDLLRQALPVLRADTNLFRTYEYIPEEPLPVPIAAYAGLDDPNLPPDQVEAWREQTSARFVFRQFEGGHFYFRDAPAFLARLGSDALFGSSEEAG